MSKPIETQDIALEFITWLRFLKPLTISITRNVDVEDFGRMIILDNASASLNLIPLTRSGTLRVTTNTAPVFGETRSVSKQAGLTVKNLMTKVNLADGSSLLFYDDGIAYVDLTFDHASSTWYYEIHNAAIVGGEVYGETNNTQSGRKRLVQRTDFGGINTHNFLNVFDTSAVSDASKVGYSVIAFSGSYGIDHYYNNNTFTQYGPAMTISGIGSDYPPSVVAGEMGAALYNVFCKQPGYANDASAGVGGIAIYGLYYNTTEKQFTIRAS